MLAFIQKSLNLIYVLHNIWKLAMECSSFIFTAPGLSVTWTYHNLFILLQHMGGLFGSVFGYYKHCVCEQSCTYHLFLYGSFSLGCRPQNRHMCFQVYWKVGHHLIRVLRTLQLCSHLILSGFFFVSLMDKKCTPGYGLESCFQDN